MTNKLVTRRDFILRVSTDFATVAAAGMFGGGDLLEDIKKEFSSTKPSIATEPQFAVHNKCSELFAYQANETRPPASLAKTMLALIVAQHIADPANKDFKDSTLLEVPESVLDPQIIPKDVQVIGALKPGRHISIKDLLLALISYSDARAAETLRHGLKNLPAEGDQEPIIRRMNNMAKHLNMDDTTYTNVIGFDPKGETTTSVKSATTPDDQIRLLQCIAEEMREKTRIGNIMKLWTMPPKDTKKFTIKILDAQKQNGKQHELEHTSPSVKKSKGQTLKNSGQQLIFCKTGFTTMAGRCQQALIRIEGEGEGEGEGEEYLAVVSMGHDTRESAAQMTDHCMTPEFRHALANQHQSLYKVIKEQASCALA